MRLLPRSVESDLRHGAWRRPRTARPRRAAPQLDTDVEMPAADWHPIVAPAERRAPDVVLFVDGVRRIDAHLWLESDDKPYPTGARRLVRGRRRALRPAQRRRRPRRRPGRARPVHRRPRPADARHAADPLRRPQVTGAEPKDLENAMQAQLHALEVAVSAGARAERRTARRRRAAAGTRAPAERARLHQDAPIALPARPAVDRRRRARRRPALAGVPARHDVAALHVVPAAARADRRRLVRHRPGRMPGRPADRRRRSTLAAPVRRHAAAVRVGAVQGPARAAESGADRRPGEAPARAARRRPAAAPVADARGRDRCAARERHARARRCPTTTTSPARSARSR